MNQPFHIPFISRRNFLQRFGSAALGTTVLARTISELNTLNTAMAAGGPPDDYKALICVFLNGGNDSNNMIIPTIPAEWENYAAIRSPVLAIPNADGGPATALSLNSRNGQNGYPADDYHDYGFHPAMPEMQALFHSGVIAPVFNVGTLSFPLTKVQYSTKSVPRPPQLFSHSDQQTQWQTSLPDQPHTSGWGGRIADLFTAANYNLNGGVSMAVTLAGSNIFEVSSSNLAPPYAITTSGAVQLTGFSGNASNGASNLPRRAALNSILATNMGSTNLQTKAYAQILDHSIDQAESLTLALAANASAPWLTRFTNTITTPNGGSTFTSGLMSQMKMVARLIDLGSRSAASGGLGMRRQIFFIQVGGYDTHTNQTNNQGSTATNAAKVIIGDHANRLADLSQTMNALYQALADIGSPVGSPIGTRLLKDSVTAFTASDFSRTFPANGYGSDHGWGGHQFVMGGAVKGGATYGKFPTLAVNGPDDTSTGRWIPTTAVDQYAATIASWFGVDDAGMETVFPNLGRFSTPNLGFL
jgi:uncharacterized protein (DUF1501 family)